MSDDDPLSGPGAWHVDCGECGADAHIVGHNRFKDDTDDPIVCPFCSYDVLGDNDLRIIDESEQ